MYNVYMGQKLQDGKKVLEMSQLHPHSKFSPFWDARKHVQEIVEVG